MFNFDPVNLILSFIFSIIGTGYFIYGKKQSRFFTMLAGVALGIFPFFVSNPWMVLLVGVGLTSVPFILTD